MAHLAGQVTAGVYRVVPYSTSQGREIPAPLAPQLLDVREQPGVALPPVEERHPVPAPERLLEQVTAEEPGPAEDEEVHRSGLTLSLPLDG